MGGIFQGVLRLHGGCLRAKAWGNVVDQIGHEDTIVPVGGKVSKVIIRQILLGGAETEEDWVGVGGRGREREGEGGRVKVCKSQTVRMHKCKTLCLS